MSYHANEENVDLILSLLDKLFKWKEIKNNFSKFILSLSDSENLLFIKASNIKQYLIKFISENLNDFCDKNILHTLIKLYLIDESSGVYENCLKLFISLLSNESGKIFIKDSNFIENILNYFELIKENNSIILIRELDIILECLKVDMNDHISETTLKKICESSCFFNYDVLTQLTFLDTMENKISEPKIVTSILKAINFFDHFQGNSVKISEMLLRKFLYTLSKFYAGRLLTQTNNIKNLLAISIQFYEDNKNEKSFIISILSNVFLNREIFSFIMDPINNSQFDFLNNIIQIIVENLFCNHF